MLEYRVTPLPTAWPGKATPAGERTRAQFKTIWTQALDRLEREIFHLDGTNVEIALDVAPQHLRNDGQLRADARPASPAVVVSFDTPTGRLVFAADQYAYWQVNVDAVARSLEKLRAVDRYGVLQGRQYSGFKALPAQSSATLSAEQAACVVADVLGRDVSADGILDDADAAKSAVRMARARTHPDRTGERTAYDQVDAAAAVLARHHGGA